MEVVFHALEIETFGAQENNFGKDPVLTHSNKL